MSAEPDENERRQLADLRKAGRVHTAILLVCVVSLLAALVLPESLRGPALFLVLVSSSLFGISFINMQFFQQCPRCKARLTLLGRSCGRCGMFLYPGKFRDSGGNWLG